MASSRKRCLLLATRYSLLTTDHSLQPPERIAESYSQPLSVLFMSRDDYYDDDDDGFGDDLHDEQDEFDEEHGFSEMDFDEESSGDDEIGDDEFGEAGSGEEKLSGTSAGEGGSGEPAAGLPEEFFEETPVASDAGEDELAWRETYFILFQHHQRPTLTQVEAAIGDSGRRLTMENLDADEDGLFQSVLVHSPEDNAALEISYEQGEAVMEQSAELAKALQSQIDSQVLAQLLRADARLDIMHFERMDEPLMLDDEGPDEIALESLNPATLISVVEALTDLTGGVPIDPSAGEILI